jgi:hypothetical protein
MFSSANDPVKVQKENTLQTSVLGETRDYVFG